ncbi:glycosyltransferase [Lysobacter rhizosphaerae]
MDRSQLLLQKAARFVSYRIALLSERVFLRSFPNIHVVSHVDAQYLRSKQKIGSAFSIPVALDDEFALTPSVNLVRDGIVIFGDIRVPHIHDGVVGFLSEYFDRYDRPSKPAKITVLGRCRPFGVLKHMADRWGGELSFVEWVPDVVSALYAAEIVVLPDLTGTGLKNRCVAALASGAVVLGTPSAFEGIDVVHGSHAVMGDTPQDLAREAIELLGQPMRIHAIGQAGREFALLNYSSSRIVNSWNERYLAASVGLGPERRESVS